MNIIKTNILDLKILEPKVFEDLRGRFIKTFTNNFFIENGLEINIKETYYSVSHKNVIRGMHFQTPPMDHFKIVYVPVGRILDVVLDLRRNSPTYGNFFSCELSDKNGKVIIIPNGLAHGFRSLEDNTNVTYMQTTCYALDNDKGIRFDSFGFDWNCKTLIISDRDRLLPALNNFETPFIFGVNS